MINRVLKVLVISFFAVYFSPLCALKKDIMSQDQSTQDQAFFGVQAESSTSTVSQSLLSSDQETDGAQPPATLELLMALPEAESEGDSIQADMASDGALLAQQDSAVLLDDFVVDEQIILDADSTINGLGNKLVFTENGRLVINEGVTLTLKNMIIAGLAQDQIVFNGQDSLLFLSDVRVRLASDVSFDEGAVCIDGDVSFKGPFMFQHNSIAGITIEPMSRLYMDLGTTLKPLLLTFQDNITSELYLNGATLTAGATGLVINRGVVICDNRVLLSAEADDSNKGLYLGDNMLIKKLANARVECHGYVSLR